MSSNGPNWYPSKNYVEHRPARPAGAPAGDSGQLGSPRSKGPIRRLLDRLSGRNPDAGTSHTTVDQ